MQQNLKYESSWCGFEGNCPDHDEYVTTLEFNKFFSTIFDEKWKQANLAIKANIGELRSFQETTWSTKKGKYFFDRQNVFYRW